MTCYMACVKPVLVRVEWGLHELGGKPRATKMNQAFMCADCYSKLKSTCIKVIESGEMFWEVEKVKLEPITQ